MNKAIDKTMVQTVDAPGKAGYDLIIVIDEETKDIVKGVIVGMKENPILPPPGEERGKRFSLEIRVRAPE